MSTPRPGTSGKGGSSKGKAAASPSSALDLLLVEVEEEDAKGKKKDWERQAKALQVVALDDCVGGGCFGTESSIMWWW